MPPRRPRSLGSSRVDAGARDKRVSIQRLTDTIGSSGMPVEDWTTLSAIALDASRVEVSGKETFGANQTSAPYETLWGIEYRADMDPDLLDIPKTRRLVYLGRTHDILAARIVGNKDGIELETLTRRG